MSNNSPSFQPTLLSDSSGDSKLQRINGVATVDNGGGPVPLGGGAASLPSTLILADASTTQAPNILTLRHTSSATPASGFGGVFAVELASAAGTVRGAMTDNTFWNVATDGAEEGRREIQLMQGGTLRSCASFGFRAGGNFPALFLGPPASDNTLGLVSTTMQLVVATTLAQQWTSALVTLNLPTKLAGTVGFNNTAPIAKPTVTGAKGSNAALASLMTVLASYGLVTDSTTA